MERSAGRFTLIYFVLLFAGLALTALGYRFSIFGFIITGAIWILVTPFAVKSTVPVQIRKWSIIFLLFGALVGIVIGIVLGESIKPIVGLIGGIVIGGVGGWVLYGIIFDHIIHFLFDAIFPKISTIILFIVFIFGAFWGAISLSDLIPKYFEAVGGGLLVGGIIGAFWGILLGTEIIKRQDEW